MTHCKLPLPIENKYTNSKLSYFVFLDSRSGTKFKTMNWSPTSYPLFSLVETDILDTGIVKT